MRIALALTVLALAVGTAAAQPSIPPPYEYGTQVASDDQVSNEDRSIIDHGEIGSGRVIGATLAAAFVGFGVGQAIEGRYGERGWIFTVGESVGDFAMFTGLLGLVGGCSEVGHCHLAYGLALGGAATFLGFRTWGILDALIAPQHRNARYRAALARNPGYAQQVTVMPYLVPVDHGSGGIAGLGLQF